MNDQSQPTSSAARDDRRPASGVSPVADGIHAIFRDIFETEVDMDDDFFDLGGDSLSGETLLAGIQRDFGISLPLSILLELSTPRSLADAIEEKMKSAMPSLLFTVSEKGVKTPLFCIHGHTGKATFARKLRAVLPDRPIYAIRVLGLLPGEVPLVSVSEMARHYIREIRKVRPSGPYHIFGQCTTASVAYEVAQQLSAAGDEVRTVTLVDPLRIKRRSGLRRFYYSLAAKRAIRTALQYPQMSGDERWRKVVEPALVAVRKTYEARPYTGHALIVSASASSAEILEPNRGYPALVPQLESVVVEGKHLDIFTGKDGAIAGPLAEAMSSFLARHD